MALFTLHSAQLCQHMRLGCIRPLRLRAHCSKDTKCFLIGAARRALCLAGMKRYCWRSVSTVLYLDATSTRTGSLRQARCSLATCARRSSDRPRRGSGTRSLIALYYMLFYAPLSDTHSTNGSRAPEYPGSLTACQACACPHDQRTHKP